MAFIDWRKQQGTESFVEEVFLAYFEDKSQHYAPSTLWSIYSMLKSKMIANHNIDISRYSRLLTFVKTKNVGFQSKQASVFTPEEIKKFLLEAPDSEFLVIKAVTVFGISGGCRGEEICNVMLGHVKDTGTSVFTPEEIKKFLLEAPDSEFLVIKVVTVFGISGGCRGEEICNVMLGHVKDTGSKIVVRISESKTYTAKLFPILSKTSNTKYSFFISRDESIHFSSLETKVFIFLPDNIHFSSLEYEKFIFHFMCYFSCISVLHIATFVYIHIDVSSYFRYVGNNNKFAPVENVMFEIDSMNGGLFPFSALVIKFMKCRTEKFFLAAKTFFRRKISKKTSFKGTEQGYKKTKQPKLHQFIKQTSIILSVKKFAPNVSLTDNTYNLFKKLQISRYNNYNCCYCNREKQQCQQPKIITFGAVCHHGKFFYDQSSDFNTLSGLCIKSNLLKISENGFRFPIQFRHPPKKQSKKDLNKEIKEKNTAAAMDILANLMEQSQKETAASSSATASILLGSVKPDLFTSSSATASYKKTTRKIEATEHAKKSVDAKKIKDKPNVRMEPAKEIANSTRRAGAARTSKMRTTTASEIANPKHRSEMATTSKISRPKIRMEAAEVSKIVKPKPRVETATTSKITNPIVEAAKEESNSNVIVDPEVDNVGSGENAEAKAFLEKHLKMDGQKNNLKSTVKIHCEGEKVVINSKTFFPKKSLRFLSKKFLKRNWNIRVLSKNVHSYEYTYVGTM
ncbi:hypothetical protein Bhyg_07935 [Pseudolycoriella hygida]|uniref:Uncharacterized protein n=1 Tax=Pseudolycoriella hygida TaxID=35572 RepID=A0A9Q0N3N4_9DIPT|nr:hypothetical protein Bhyg_07935 [Pseudolycoriella hygida]